MTSSSLVVVFDNIGEEKEKLNYLIDYVALKLSIVGVYPARILLISKQDLPDIVTQLMYNQDNQMNTIFTATTPDCDSLVNKLNNSEHKFIHFITSTEFHAAFATVLDALVRSSHYLFDSHSQSAQFIADNKLSPSDYIIRTNTNYASVQVDLIKVDSSRLASKPDFFMNNNLVNADLLVYQFEKFVQLQASSPEIKYLLSKVDLTQFISKLKHTINIIENIRASHATRSDEICVSFNGGKDCCVVLYLYFAVALRHAFKFPLKALFIQIPNSFPEMNQFVEDELERFFQHGMFEMIRYNDVNSDKFLNLKESLQMLKDTRPTMKYILMGVRKSDGPYFLNMPEFAPTDAGWPQFTRVNPILDWTYSEIWLFIRCLKLPYCSLYDEGFTSVDNTLNSVPNEALMDSKTSKHLPAYWLDNQELERKSRRKN